MLKGVVAAVTASLSTLIFLSGFFLRCIVFTCRERYLPVLSRLPVYLPGLMGRVWWGKKERKGHRQHSPLTNRDSR
uniref:Uncharacterized protein n=1 Tax=Picea glauca TaxID=3330 RepID=A0A101LZB1_PICGL|nr:hypothetical protein ABT39_MTgene5135 [Picea glauca]QHR86426.1 hypothetical protein Q903MT_gene425 [Picea sitchensis]